MNATCFWCQGRLLVLIDGLPYCPKGCAAADTAPYRKVCPECGSDFNTGNQSADLCPTCDAAERLLITAQEGTPAEWQGHMEIEHESFDRAAAGDTRERLKRRGRQHRWADLASVNRRTA